MLDITMSCSYEKELDTYTEQSPRLIIKGKLGRINGNEKIYNKK